MVPPDLSSYYCPVPLSDTSLSLIISLYTSCASAQSDCSCFFELCSTIWSFHAFAHVNCFVSNAFPYPQATPIHIFRPASGNFSFLSFFWAASVPYMCLYCVRALPFHLHLCLWPWIAWGEGFNLPFREQHFIAGTC